MILVTAFEPFAGLESNPSEDVARTLEDRDVDCCVLPVSYRSIEDVLLGALRRPWDGVLMLGLARERDAIHLERVARNTTDGTQVDNEGSRSLRRRVVRGGPAAYFSSLPLERMLEQLRRARLPAALSSDAGRYLCNQAFYLARHALAPRGVPCGLVHLPPTPELATTTKGLALTEQVRAVRLLVEVLRGHTR